MKKLLISSILILTIYSCGDGTSATSFQHIIDEYKSVMCVGFSSSASMTERTNALARQLELNKEYEEALLKLSDSEKSKLIMSWAKALAEVTDGDC